ncbi:MAG: SRPBCC domain-containing protein [Terricaulis sp.]
MSAVLADDELLITRTFDAPIGLMFQLWSDVDHFRNWMGPEGFDCPAMEMDFRVSGTYRGMIRSQAYGDSWFGGEYREIEAPARLVFTWKWDTGPSGEVTSLITISFREHNGQTTMTFHQTPFVNVERRDSHYQGWTSLFNKLAAYAAKQQEQRT